LRKTLQRQREIAAVIPHRKIKLETLNVWGCYRMVIRFSWVGHVARRGDGKGAYRVLLGRPEGNGPLGRHRHRWEDDVKEDFQNWVEEVWNGLIWLRLGIGGGPY
jgi:hypothetical protein